MLPVATAQRDECRDNRLANWVDGAPAARLEAAAVPSPSPEPKP